MTIEELEAEIATLSASLGTAKSALDDGIRNLRMSAETSMAPMRNQLRELKAELAEARSAIASHPHEGKRVSTKRNVGTSYMPRYETIYGVVEVFRVGTEFPANLSHYSIPKVGEAFVRLLKKDGKPGKAIDTRLRGWKLEDGSDLS